MLGHMQKFNHFWAQIKKCKMSVRPFLPRALIVKCHRLIQWFIFTGLPDAELPLNGIDDGEENMDVEQQKRGIKRQGDHESDDEGNSVAPPVNDIYRTRQQKRVH